MLLEDLGLKRATAGKAADQPPAPGAPKPGGRSRKVVWLALLALLWLGYAVLAWWADRSALQVATDSYLTARNVAYNALVGLAFLLLLWGLTRRLLFSMLLVGGFQTLLYMASATKLAILGNPVALQDFYFLTSFNRANVALLGSYVDGASGAWLWVLGAPVVLGLAFWLERPVFRRFGYAHCGVLGVGAMLVVSLYFATWPWTALYTKEKVRPSPLSLTPAVLHAGLMSSLVYKHLETSNTVFTVDEEALRKALAATSAAPVADAAPGVGGWDGRAAGPAPASDATAPDIVVILSESFMDPRVLNGMGAVRDVIPGVRSQLERGRGGMMTVPAYGGGTVRTEFEVLTGMPVQAFPSVMYPYVDLSRKRLPGLASVLRERGYSTAAVHGNSGAFWNRTNTYTAMEIDHFVTGTDFRDKAVIDGGWYSDGSMTDIIFQELDRGQAPAFVFAVSIENHGPYDKVQPVLDQEAWDDLQLPQRLNGDAALSMRNYLYHLGNADRQFVRLIDGLRQRGRPYVVAFFGDHLPALGEAYGTLEFVDGGSPESQQVPWAIVSGQGDGPLEVAQGSIHSWQLPAEVLDAAGIHGDPYFDFVRRLGRQLGNVADEGEERMLQRGINAAAVARLDDRFESYAQ